MTDNISSALKAYLDWFSGQCFLFKRGVQCFLAHWLCEWKVLKIDEKCFFFILSNNLFSFSICFNFSNTNFTTISHCLNRKRKILSLIKFHDITQYLNTKTKHILWNMWRYNVSLIIKLCQMMKVCEKNHVQKY